MLSALVLSAAAGRLAADCTPEWRSGYNLPGINGQVYCAILHDDGTGSKLYIGGQFYIAGNEWAMSVARWNGSAWEQVGAPGVYAQTNGNGLARVRAMAVHQGNLYIGGQFRRAGNVNATNVAFWNGTNWSALGNGVSGTSSEVFALASNNGLLYIAGQFTTAGTTAVGSIASWNGSTYAALGTGLRTTGGAAGRGNALSVFNGELCVAGDFSNAGGIADTGRIAKWTGSAWASLGGSITGTSANALLVLDDDGAGPNPPALYAAGAFDHAGGTPGIAANNVAKYDGSAWSALGDGLSVAPNTINALAGFDAGSGIQLYAAGINLLETGGTVDAIKRWTGAVWEAVPGGPTTLSTSGSTGFGNTLLTADLDGAGPQSSVLILGGQFEFVGQIPSPNLIAFNGTTWSPILPGEALWSNAGTNSFTGLVVGDEDDAGPLPTSLYAYGNFVTAGTSVAKSGVARRNGTDWTALVGPTLNPVAAVFYNDGSGSKLHVIGQSGTTIVLSKWDGSNWTTVFSSDLGTCRTAIVWDDDGAGPHTEAIYIGGNFSDLGVMKWDGAAWSFIGGAPGTTVPTDTYSFTVYSGALYAAAGIKNPDDSTGPGVARWDGTDWTRIGTSDLAARTLSVYQGKLYVGGEFTTMDAVNSPGIASWDGSTWADVGGGTQGVFPAGRPQVFSLCTADDGTGSKLFLGGQFETAGNVTDTHGAAIWDGTAFRPMGNGLLTHNVSLTVPAIPSVSSIVGLNGSVWFAGNFHRTNGIDAHRIAEWRCVGSAPTSGDLNCDQSVNLADLDAFIVALIDPDGYAAAYPTCQITLADVNQDGNIDGRDISPFTALLTGP